MPWDHCGRSIADDTRCPACGLGKPAWTLKFDKTRTFVLSGYDEGAATSQVDTLERASDAGAPFCEECEKAKKEAQAQQAEAKKKEEEEAGSAQADSLERASESGAPFCEECEKAKKEQQAQQSAGV